MIEAKLSILEKSGVTEQTPAKNQRETKIENVMEIKLSKI